MTLTFTIPHIPQNTCNQHVGTAMNNLLLLHPSLTIPHTLITIHNSAPSGHHGESGSTGTSPTTRPILQDNGRTTKSPTTIPDQLANGLTTRNHLSLITLTTTTQQNLSLHSPPTVPRVTITTIAISKDPTQSNLARPLSLQDTSLWISMLEKLKSGHAR